MANRIRNGIFILIDLICIALFYAKREVLQPEKEWIFLLLISLTIVCMIPGLVFGDGKGEKCPKTYKSVTSFLDRAKHILSILFLLVIPVLNYFNEEIIYGGRVDEFGKRRIVLGILIIYSVVGLLVLIINNMQISMNIITVALTIFSTGNYYVNSFRGSPAIASDIYSVSTALSVSGSYEYKLSWQVFRGVVLAILLIQIVYLIPMHKLFKWKLRVAVLAVWAVCSFGFYYVFFTTEYFEKKFAEYRLSYFHPNTSYKRYGSVLIFTLSIKRMQVEVPEGYSDKDTIASMDECMSRNGEDVVTGNVDIDTCPNVIVIMDEAFCDLSDGKLSLTSDPLPFLHSLTENTIKGTMYTSIFGGNTANTEFEFLTGNTVGFLPNGVIAYTMYVHDGISSFTNNMLSYGYGGDLATHPYEARGFNRPAAYSALGFADFLAEDKFMNPSYLRGHMTDAADFNNIIELYEAYENGTSQYGLSKEAVGGNAPFYLFNVTMQNHSGYDEKGFDSTIFIEDREDKYPEAEQFITLTNITDREFEKLLNYFANVEKPTVIVMFGDHKPGLSNAFYNDYAGVKSMDQEMEFRVKYSVDYWIWANYDIPEIEGLDISANYLGAYLTELLNLPLTGYQKFLLEMREHIPVLTSRGYLDANNNYYAIDDKGSPEYNWVLQYSKYQYNNIFGKRYNKFFAFGQ